MKNRTASGRRDSHASNLTAGDTFIDINERPVDDISLDFFYKPHTVTLLGIAVVAVMYCAFVRLVKCFLSWRNL